MAPSRQLLSGFVSLSLRFVGTLGIAIACAVATISRAVPAAAQGLAIVGGEVRTVSGPVLEEATILIRDGTIEGVGADVSAPSGYDVIDASGLVVTPGFIDARTSLALPPGATLDRAHAIRADFNVRDTLGPLVVPGAFGQEARDTPVHPWLMNGVTTAYVATSERHIIGGRGAVVKLTADERVRPVEREAEFAASLRNGPLTVSISQAPLETFGDRDAGGPTTRQGVVALLRQWLSAAVRAGDVRPGERIRLYAHSPDDIITALRVAEEFELTAIIDGAAGANLVSEELAAAEASVVVGPAIMGLGGGGAHEMYAHSPYNAARLHAAGVPFALSTDGTSGRSVAVEAAIARAHGLPPEAALRAVTLDAARILGVDRRLGSIETGKDADLVLWSGDPVGTWGDAQVVLVDGRVVFRRSDR